VAILIDNLDEAWGPSHETSVLATLLLGLLRVTRDIYDNFHHQDYWQKGINLCLTLFLRSDIFAYIHPLAVEQDKWPLIRMTWNDREVLLRVIDNRLTHGIPNRYTADDVWAQLFPAEVAGLPTKDFITENTLRRPRDVIYLIKEAIAGAVNRGHAAISPEDLLDAREKYSRFVFSSILAEDDPEKGFLEAVLYEFAGAKRILSASDVRKNISNAGVQQGDVDFYLNLLCDVNFLGIHSTSGFTFASDENDRQMLLRVAERLTREGGIREQAFEVNPAFHLALQID
jgi:hypothetical protein